MAAAEGSADVVEPETRIVPISSAPPIPPSLQLATGLKDPDSPEPADDYPVIVWGDYTYWPLSYVDGRLAMCLIAYDLVNEEVKEWELVGARDVVTVTIDKLRQQITLLGHSSASVTVSWNEIGSVVPRNPQYFWILNHSTTSPDLACRSTAAFCIPSVRLDTRAVADDQLWLLDNGRQAIFPKIGSPGVCFDHYVAPDQSIPVTLAPTNWRRPQQRWILNSAGNLKSAATNLLATVSASERILLQVPTSATTAQLWYMKPYVPSPDLSTDQFPHLIPGEAFMLLNTEQVISSRGSAGPLTLVPEPEMTISSNSMSSSALWLYNRGGAIVNAQDGLAITASSPAVSGTASVLASSWTGGPEQQWALTALGYLVCKANGLLMVARGESLVLASYDALGPSNEIWSLRFVQGRRAPATTTSQLAFFEENSGMPHSYTANSSSDILMTSLTSIAARSSSRDNIITQLTVTARVSDEFWAGTDDQIFIAIGSSRPMNLTSLFNSPSRGDEVTVPINLEYMFDGKSEINLRDDVDFISLWQVGVHPLVSDAWKLESIILKAKSKADNLEFTNNTFQKVAQWLDNHSPQLKIVWSSPIPWGAWLDAKRQKPVDLNGDTYSLKWRPYILDILKWLEYDPSKIEGVGTILGMKDGRLIGELLKPPRQTEVLQPSDDMHSYTWVFTPQGSIIYKLWDKTDRSQYIRHSQLGSGQPVICAGEMQMNKKVTGNYVVTDVIALVNDASGHYQPDGGACLRYVGQKLQELGIPTDDISWYSR